MQIYKKTKKCRICNSSYLAKYLNLGKTALANSLMARGADKKEKLFPLEVLFCRNCYLSQLSIVVNPKYLFSEYAYRSSVSRTFQEHCAKMAKRASELVNPKENSLVVDIASNDGCLLQQFRKLGFKTLGVEPAKNLVNIANSKGIKTIHAFWGAKTAKEILKKCGFAKVITATNVLAHVDNLRDFIGAVNILLDKDGLFIVEVPYLNDLLTKNEFDTIYHEHLSYFLVKPLKILYKSNGLNIVNVEKYSIHGGSLRIYASRNSSGESKSLQDFLELERKENLCSLGTYLNFDKNVKRIKNELLNLLMRLKREQKTVAAYGASAKGSTLLNYCAIDRKLIKFIIDDTPEKQNKRAPGSKIPIKDASFLEKEKPDYIVLLAWNFAQEIMEKTKEFKSRGGKYIIPIPKVKVI